MNDCTSQNLKIFMTVDLKNPSSDVLNLLGEYVDEVQQTLIHTGTNIPFFIAGGSIFSTLKNTTFHDLDVFFYCEKDLKKALFVLKKKHIC